MKTILEMQEPELFFLVEYKEDDKIKGRWLFRTSDEAKSFIENDLGIKYRIQDTYYTSFNLSAEIITLTI